jgi:hypothetical protein
MDVRQSNNSAPLPSPSSNNHNISPSPSSFDPSTFSLLSPQEQGQGSRPLAGSPAGGTGVQMVSLASPRIVLPATAFASDDDHDRIDDSNGNSHHTYENNDKGEPIGTYSSPLSRSSSPSGGSSRSKEPTASTALQTVAAIPPRNAALMSTRHHLERLPSYLNAPYLNTDAEIESHDFQLEFIPTAPPSAGAPPTPLAISSSARDEHVTTEIHHDYV